MALISLPLLPWKVALLLLPALPSPTLLLHSLLSSPSLPSKILPFNLCPGWDPPTTTVFFLFLLFLKALNSLTRDHTHAPCSGSRVLTIGPSGLSPLSAHPSHPLARLVTAATTTRLFPTPKAPSPGSPAVCLPLHGPWALRAKDPLPLIKFQALSSCSNFSLVWGHSSCTEFSVQSYQVVCLLFSVPV